MRRLLASVGAAFLVIAAVAMTSDAEACGGCFHIQQGETSQVTGHRMIFSVSNDKTTLWDQISYSGAPESFAWVLPIHGAVDVGLSSDALFEQLDGMTTVRVFSPDINCPTCAPFQTATAGVTASSTGSGGGVTIISQETVGPYETVQLSSADPAALQTWLTDHSYAIPADTVPIIDGYVAEGFDFLVMKLVPGQNVSAMRPVRVTSPGAGLALPLRMVAAGTGVTTPITLWVTSEGRYEPANFPVFTIDHAALVWDWDTQSSNYKQLVQAGFDATQGKGWLMENATVQAPGTIDYFLKSYVESSPVESGYGADAPEALAACDEDLKALFGSIDPNSFWLTRLHAELPKDALADDLQLTASQNQDFIYSSLTCPTSIGTPPKCPPIGNCNPGSTSVGGGGGMGGSGGSGGSGGVDPIPSGGCAMGPTQTGVAGLLTALATLLAMRRTRRPQKST